MWLELNSITCKLEHRYRNEVVFKLKYLDSHTLLESDYTNPVKAYSNIKEDSTVYKWLTNEKCEMNPGSQSLTSDSNRKCANNLLFDKMLMSVQELRGSNLELYMYEIKYEIEALGIKRASSYFGTGYKSNNLEPSSRSTIITPNPPSRRGDSSLHDKFIDTLELNQADSKMNLKHKYNEIGYSRINFYKIFSEKDNAILKQSSQIFQTLSYLYRSPNVESLPSKKTSHETLFNYNFSDQGGKRIYNR